LNKEKLNKKKYKREYEEGLDLLWASDKEEKQLVNL